MIRPIAVCLCVLALAACGETTPSERVGGKTRAAWTAQLKEFSPGAKTDALEALAQFKDPPLALIAEHVDSEIRSVRVGAVRALGTAGPAALPYAEKLVGFMEKDPQDLDPKTAKALRDASMDALGKIGAETLTLFSFMLASESPSLRARAVYTLRPFATELKDGVNTILPLLKDDHAVVRREAAKSLAVVGKGDRRASEALMAALGDLDANVSAAAAVALGEVGGRSDVEGKALSKLLYAHRQDVRASAAYGLGLMGTEATPYLKQVRDLMQNDNRRVVRIQAARAHYRISGSADAALVQLEKDVACKDIGLCKDAIKAMGEMGPEAAPAINSLVPYLEFAQSRLAAAQALGEIGPAAKSALPQLARASEAAKEGSAEQAEIDRIRSAIRGE